MNFLIWSSLLLLISSMAILLFRKSIWMRLLGLNLASVKILIMIIAYASLQVRTFLLDLAIIYALSSFIGIIFITLFALNQAGGKGKIKWKR